MCLPHTHSQNIKERIRSINAENEVLEVFTPEELKSKPRFWKQIRKTKVSRLGEAGKLQLKKMRRNAMGATYTAERKRKFDFEHSQLIAKLEEELAKRKWLEEENNDLKKRIKLVNIMSSCINFLR